MTTTPDSSPSYFETAKRDNGEIFVRRTPDAPEWVADAVMEAHDGEAPNDWRYAHCRYIFDLFMDGSYDPVDLDGFSEIADQLVDISNHDRLVWLMGDLTREGYVNDAIEEGQPFESLSQTIGAGQSRCLERMVYTIAEAITANAHAERAV